MNRYPMPRRRTPLRRTPPQPVKAKVSRARRVAASTGPTPAQRRTVLNRAGGCCELCGQALWTPDTGWLAPHSFHHRQPRGMGGSTAETNTPERLLLLCGTATTPGCHEKVESMRGLAYAAGWLVKRPADPAAVPVTLHGVGLVTLTRAGGYQLEDGAA